MLRILFKERRFPRFISKEMESMYIEELRASVNLLMANLESLPVSKGGPEFKLQKLKRSQNSAFLDLGDENEIQLSKSDVVLSFTLEVSRGPSPRCRDEAAPELPSTFGKRFTI